MEIYGLQKMTLLDFPGRVACTVFLHGCNYRCPFCHNAQLLAGGVQEPIPEAKFMEFLKKRVGLLDGVCVSGGEPTLSSGLKSFIRQIKELGFAVKLDTNGSRPQVLKELVGEGLLDYVAMDIKNAPSRYAETCGVFDAEITAIAESAAFLISGAVASEFRTTVALPLHDGAAIAEMGQWLWDLAGGKPVERLFLQPFVDRDTVAYSGLRAPDAAQMAEFIALLQPFVTQVAIRG